jgi:hypothetical protein
MRSGVRNANALHGREVKTRRSSDDEVVGSAFMVVPLG